MKRVLFVIDSLNCGGAERSLISLLPLLDKTKYAIELMIMQRGGDFEQYVPQNVKIISFENIFSQNFFQKVKMFFAKKIFSVKIRLNSKRAKPLHGAELWWQIVGKNIPKSDVKYDVAVAYQQGFPTYLLAEKICATQKIAWVNVDIIKAGYAIAYNEKFYEKIDKIVAVSDELQKILQNQYMSMRSKMCVIYDIFNCELMQKLSEQQGFDDDFGGLRILTIGRMVPQKGYDIAVGAARILNENKLNFKWYAIGAGSSFAEISNLINEYGLQQKFILLGKKYNPYPYLRECDIYAQTSKFEGFGMTLTEARLFHKPLVSTNFSVVANQIENEQNGIIADMNAESVAAALMRLINDNGLREKLIENTKREVNTTAQTEPLKVESLLDKN